MDIGDVGQLFALVERLIVCISAAMFAFPMLLNAVRWGRKGHLAAIRICAAVSSLGIFTISFYAVLVWIDIVFFDGSMFGPAEKRWVFNNIVWLPLTVACPWFVWIYGDTLKFFTHRKSDNEDEDTN